VSDPVANESENPMEESSVIACCNFRDSPPRPESDTGSLAQIMIRDLDAPNCPLEYRHGRDVRLRREEAEGAIAHQLLKTVFPHVLESLEADLHTHGILGRRDIPPSQRWNADHP